MLASVDLLELQPPLGSSMVASMDSSSGAGGDEVATVVRGALPPLTPACAVGHFRGRRHLVRLALRSCSRGSRLLQPARPLVSLSRIVLGEARVGFARGPSCNSVSPCTRAATHIVDLVAGTAAMPCSSFAASFAVHAPSPIARLQAASPAASSQCVLVGALVRLGDRGCNPLPSAGTLGATSSPRCRFAVHHQVGR